MSPTLFITLLIGANDPPLFEKDVLPILREHCFDCHSSGRRKHGLDVRQRRLLVRGGDSGPAVKPGDAAGSLLLRRVSQGEMPPGSRAKLSPAEVERLRAWIAAGAPASGDEPPIVEAEGDFITPEDRKHWSFQPVRRPEIPPTAENDRVRTPIDALALARLKALGLPFAPDAEARALLRRVAFDLTGLPPSPEESEEFLRDTSAATSAASFDEAYGRLIERLLASPAYGERWGRHWLDAAGYSDSDGSGEADPERPHHWKYLDYVVRSLNADKPFNEFLEEQLAGDELAGWPGSELSPRVIELLTATAFLRCAADGTGQGGMEPARAQNQTIADTINILGTGVLGLTLGCCQCHDHRYDPISQRDYHRIRAALEPALDPTAWKPPAARRVSLYRPEDRQRAEEVARRVEAKRAERNGQEGAAVKAALEKVFASMPDAERAPARAAYEKPAAQRSDEEKKLLERNPNLGINGGNLYQYDQPAADRIKALDAEIGRIAGERPPEDFVFALWEEPGKVPPSRLLIRGQPDAPAEEVPPGIPAIFAPPAGKLALDPPAVDSPGDSPRALRTSGRRLALARWLTRPEHPLTSRVLANRIWMHHFGRGLVATPGDFGRQGEAPSHPEILDLLAAELVAGGWRLKPLHRLILTSTVYRQSAVAAPASLEKDPEGIFLSRKAILRIEAETLRDAILAASGSLNRKLGGPHVPVSEDADGSIVVGVIEKAESNRPGKEVSPGGDTFRRTLYVETRRTRPLSFTAAFDAPLLETNCPRRSVTTVATQALTLLNGGFVRDQADRFAHLLERERADIPARIERAFRIAYARPPTAAETERAFAFLKEAGEPHRALADFCQVLLNSSEFIYVD